MKSHQLELLSQPSFGLSRRTFLRGSAFTALALAAGLVPQRAAGLAPASIPFSLGIASGDPTHDSVVLWTRLAVDPAERRWHAAGANRGQVEDRHGPALAATSCGRGTFLALPEDGHSVHVAVNGLAPDRWYWYQFESEARCQPGRANQDISGAGQQTRAPAVCVRFVPALGGGLLYGVGAPGAGGYRFRRFTSATISTKTAPQAAACGSTCPCRKS